MFFKPKKKLPYFIFQIGFNRCGTSSIAYLFEQNGYSAAHWNKGTIAVGIELAKIKGESLLSYCPKYDLYTDMEKVNMWRLPKLKWRYPIFRKYLKEAELDIQTHPPIYAFKYFKTLYEQYPGSKFILNTRDKQDWLNSRLNLNLKNNRITYRSCRCGDNIHNSEEELMNCWSNEWDEHINAVTEYFSDKSNDLLLFDIQTDSPQKFTDFFSDLELDLTHWEKRNQGR